MEKAPILVSELRTITTPVRNVSIEQKEKLSVTNKIAMWITSKVGTFGFFVFTICLTIIPFIIPGLMSTVQFISSAFLQLVLLPLIMMGQNLQSAHTDARSEADFEVNTKAELEIETILTHLENQNAILQQQNEVMMEMMKKIESKADKNPTV